MSEMQVGPEEDFEEDNDEYETASFRKQLYNHLTPKVKQFLIDHFNERLINAEANIFRDIEQTIKTDILLHAVIIPDLLYRHRTITDNDEFDNALNNFKRQPGIQFHWPENDHWYDQPNEESDDDDLTDMDEDARLIIGAANKILEDNNNFKEFMQPCCYLVIKETQLYLERVAVFDLTILSPEGFNAVQDAILVLAETLAEDLYSITENM